jgi:hypothetical protein
LKEQYQYWEDDNQKETRLRELWIKSKRRQLEGNTQVSKLNDEIADLVRTLRRKIDQQLMKGRKHPVFGANYRNYNEEEFMVDADIEFHKIKKFLQTDQHIIKQDPEIGYRYQELIKTLKRKKVIENSVPRFGAEDLDNYYVEGVKAEIEEEAVIEEPDYAEDSIMAKTKRITSLADEQDLVASKSMSQVEDKIEKAKQRIVAEFENILDKQNIKKPKKITKGKIQPPKGASAAIKKK